MLGILLIIRLLVSSKTWLLSKGYHETDYMCTSLADEEEDRSRLTDIDIHRLSERELQVSFEEVGPDRHKELIRNGVSDNNSLPKKISLPGGS